MIESIKSYLLHNANQNNKDSISAKLRKKRFEFFLQYCSNLHKPLNIIDLGGSICYWSNLGFINNDNYKISILNIEEQDTGDCKNITFIKGDVRNLSFIDDKSYDLVFSNSLLEHLNTFEDQNKLAKEIMRIGKHFFIQTPNYYFPVEPHFLFPFFQFFSEDIRTRLVSNYNLGWFQRQADKEKAAKLASSIRLLKRNELKEMFFESKIYSEKFFLLNKSFIVYS